MQYPQDPAALSHLEPVVAHELRVALTSYRHADRRQGPPARPSRQG